MRLSVDEAFRRYGDRVFSAAFSVCRNREDADDAVQDTFLKYYAKNVDYADETHLKAWLLRVAINRAKDITGAFWRRNRVSWEDYMNELEFVQPEDRSLFEAVMRLPEKYRIVIHQYPSLWHTLRKEWHQFLLPAEPPVPALSLSWMTSPLPVICLFHKTKFSRSELSQQLQGP